MNRVRRGLVMVVIGLVALGLPLFIVSEPFLNLPPVWQQLSIGVVLTSYTVWIMLGAALSNRRLWPLRWRLKRTPPHRVQFIERFIDFTWGIDR